MGKQRTFGAECGCAHLRSPTHAGDRQHAHIRSPADGIGETHQHADRHGDAASRFGNNIANASGLHPRSDRDHAAANIYPGSPVSDRDGSDSGNYWNTTLSSLMDRHEKK